MRSPRLTILPAATLLAVAACSPQRDNEQATAEPTGMQTPGENTAAGSGNAMTMAETPYSQAEMQMNERMMAANGTTPAAAWANKMIEHHRGAIAMAEIVLQQSPPPQIRQMAQKTIDKQRNEVGELQKMTGGDAQGEAGEIFRPAMMKMHESMMAATGADPSQTWVRKMIEHHRGAIDMADTVLAQNPPAETRAFAEKIKADQQKDIAELERMQKG